MSPLGETTDMTPFEEFSMTSPSPGSRAYRATADRRLDPSGQPYYWIAGMDMTPAGEPDGDHAALRDGFVSVTPLHANLTHEASLARVAEWGLELPTVGEPTSGKGG